MSEKALKWVASQAPAGATAKFVLKVLAAYANNQGDCWCAVGRLAWECGVCIRTVQYKLRGLETDGFITKTGRVHRLGTRPIPIYHLELDKPEMRPDPARNRKPVDQIPDACIHAIGCSDIGATDCSPIDKEEEIKEGRRARQDDQDVTCLVHGWSVPWPDTVAFPEKYLPALDAVLQSYPAAELSQVCDLLLKDLEKRQMSKRRPLILHKAIATYNWQDAFDPGRAAARKAAGRLPVASGWNGPPEVRQAMAADARLGEGFCASYLDPSGWDPATRTIRPMTRPSHMALSTRPGMSSIISEFALTIGELAERGGGAKR